MIGRFNAVMEYDIYNLTLYYKYPQLSRKPRLLGLRFQLVSNKLVWLSANRSSP